MTCCVRDPVVEIFLIDCSLVIFLQKKVIDNHFWEIYLLNEWKYRAAQSTKKSPELLVRYCDLLLKKSNKNPEDQEMENTLNQVMVVFKYLKDKEAFEYFYSIMLRIRLICDMCSPDEVEFSMIGKLKHAYGFEYTSKLQKMCQDKKISTFWRKILSACQGKLIQVCPYQREKITQKIVQII